MKEKDSKH